jgi:hypothetical protein
MRVHELKTKSGSIYTIREYADGSFWLDTRRIVVTEESEPYEGQEKIEKPAPWPPVVGQCQMLGRCYRRDHETDLRWRGKRTSPLTEYAVREISL